MTELHPDFGRIPVAHRALHDRLAGRIENSRAAVRAAVDAGYAIEIDVQESADGRAMVFHDDTLDRLTRQTGPVRERTAAELAAIALRDGDDGIPTLEDVLEIVSGRVPLLIEIKDQSQGLSATTGKLEAAVARGLESYGGPVAVMSFNPDAVANMGMLAPSVPRGLTTCAFDAGEWKIPAERARALTGIPDYERVGASFVSHHWKDLAHPRIAELKAQGALVLCWTIRSREAEAEARRVASNITFEGYLANIPAA